MRNPGLTHIAHINIRNVPVGPLPLRSSGICPDAIPNIHRTAHQFASLLMRNPGLTGRFHSVPAGFARMPSYKACPLRISSLSLLIRNPGLTHIAHENIRNVPCGPLPLRSSGVCPDAIPQSLPTAYQFAFAPDTQSGLKKATKSLIRKSTSWR